MSDDEQSLDVPYIQSPMTVVEAALDLAEVSEGDVLLDLGCGDGRVLVAAARRGARAVGVDISADRVAAASLRIARGSLASVCAVERCDFLRPGFAIGDEVTVVYLFGTPGVNAHLTGELERVIRRGARAVTYNFHVEFGAPGFELSRSRRGALRLTSACRGDRAAGAAVGAAGSPAPAGTGTGAGSAAASGCGRERQDQQRLGAGASPGSKSRGGLRLQSALCTEASGNVTTPASRGDPCSAALDTMD